MFVVHGNLYRQIISEIIGNKGKTILKQYIYIYIYIHIYIYM